MNNLGFTGSRHGLTEIQKKVLIDNIIEFRYNEILNFKTDINKPFNSLDGCCIGADDIFYNICDMLSFNTIGYPGFYSTHPMRSKILRNRMKAVKSPLQRNKNIVYNSNLMIACPNTKEEIKRSGTWATIRYTKQLIKPLIIIYPDGNIEKFNI